MKTPTHQGIRTALNLNEERRPSINFVYFIQKCVLHASVVRQWKQQDERGKSQDKYDAKGTAATATLGYPGVTDCLISIESQSSEEKGGQSFSCGFESPIGFAEEATEGPIAHQDLSYRQRHRENDEKVSQT